MDEIQTLYPAELKQKPENKKRDREARTFRADQFESAQQRPSFQIFTLAGLTQVLFCNPDLGFWVQL